MLCQSTLLIFHSLSAGNGYHMHCLPYSVCRKWLPDALSALLLSAGNGYQIYCLPYFCLQEMVIGCAVCPTSSCLDRNIVVASTCSKRCSFIRSRVLRDSNSHTTGPKALLVSHSAVCMPTMHISCAQDNVPLDQLVDLFQQMGILLTTIRAF